MIVLLLLLLALFGHAVLWTAFVNRLHASAVPYRIVNGLSYAALAVVVAIPLIFAASIWRAGITPFLRDWGRLTMIHELPAGWLFYLTIWWHTFIRPETRPISRPTRRVRWLMKGAR